jgi:hypothetical protein
LTITWDFTDFMVGGTWGSLHNDAWDLGTTDDEKRLAAQAVMVAAGDYWEQAYLESTVELEQSITVAWCDEGGTALARGGTGWSTGPGYPMFNGYLEWEINTDFFVDLTPWENSEYGESSSRSADFGGGEINVERVFFNADIGTVARDHHDLLSVAIHEIGHALGMIGLFAGWPGYPKYDALDQGLDGDLDLPDGSQIPHEAGHLTYTTSPPGANGFPFDGATLLGSYYPMAMGESIPAGARKLLSEADILTLAAVHGFDNVNGNPILIPEPSAAVLALLSAALIGWRRRRPGVG